ncbi:OLC1v1001930C1 [Oldenlandia corymbosa var. corymbosa]|uniref:Pectinesterase n=1 Tax=Oldenlandia corymbosa var. corymbosa TaxID=529605 RepID=A0AAV1D8Y2_OLDCO|nr:OLC1v1001930C1 [Oldenlandia corymbosa var. corymbosa]
MAGGETRKKYAILGVSTLILVAMVVAITVGTRNASTDNYNRQQELTESQKAVQAICSPTDYKDTCINSLKSVDSADPKELMIAAFKATANHLKQAAANSTLLQALEKDPRTKIALDNCRELAEHAVEDLEKSFNRFDSFDINNLDDMLDDIQTWLSGAITYQETCLDGFEDVPGEAGEKMRKALNTSMELSSNGLAMINDISSIVSTLDLPSITSRRLLSDEFLGLGAEFPSWFDWQRRKLIQGSASTIKPDLVVAKDGSGKYRTINEALKDIPKKSNKTFVLYIKEGIYEEKVTFEKSHMHLMVIGDGPTKTRITGKLNFVDGTPTYHSATVAVLGDFFIAKDIGFENSAGANKHQAVALRVGADKVIFHNCHMDGYQDTLYAHTYRQFYRDCQISGTIDFIFGDSAAVFQNCTMVVRKPLDNQQCIVTAQGRKDVHQPTGFTLQNCTVVADPEYFPYRFQLKSYLGRPWKEFSRTIIVESYIDDLIHPDGWLPWSGTFALDTLFYAEFNNRGPASNKNLRVQWQGVKELPVTRVERFLAAKFIEGDSWIPATGVPYSPGFIFPPPKEDPKIKYSVVAPEEIKDLGSPKEKASYKLTPIADSTNGTKSNSTNIAGPESPDTNSTVSLLTPPTGATLDPVSNSGSMSIAGNISGNESPDSVPVITPPAGAQSPRTSLGLGPTPNTPPKSTSSSMFSWFSGKLW